MTREEWLELCLLDMYVQISHGIKHHTQRGGQHVGIPRFASVGLGPLYELERTIRHFLETPPSHYEAITELEWKPELAEDVDRTELVNEITEAADALLKEMNEGELDLFNWGPDKVKAIKLAATRLR